MCACDCVGASVDSITVHVRLRIERERGLEGLQQAIIGLCIVVKKGPGMVHLTVHVNEKFQRPVTRCRASITRRRLQSASVNRPFKQSERML